MNLKSFDISLTERCDIPENTCLLAYRGSIAHGMYIPNTDPNSIDDVDLMGIALGEPENYLGLHEWASRGTYEYKQDKWDCVYYEIRKIFSLLLQGNPNVLSLLWCQPEHYLLMNDAGKLIVSSRHLFVGKHVYNAFAGYAHAQLEKMETRDPAELRMYMAVTTELKYRGIHPNHKGEVIPYPEGYDTNYDEPAMALAMGDEKLITSMRRFQKKGENIGYLGDKRKQLVIEHGYDSKNAAHCIRLLRMCKEFMETGELQVMRQDADELLEIKRGEWPLEKVKAHANLAFEECRIAKDNSRLPDEPNRVKIEELLVDILYAHLQTFRS